MKRQPLWFFGLGLIFVVGQHSHLPNAHALTAAEVVVKKSIADTMTPEELAAYKERLASKYSNVFPPSALPPQLPNDVCTGATHEIGALPFGPTDTTVGATNNFDLPPKHPAGVCRSAPEGLWMVAGGKTPGSQRAVTLRLNLMPLPRRGDRIPPFQVLLPLRG